MTKYYHKLVRDRIPQIIEASGSTCVTQILNAREYLAHLDAKLTEELAEYHQSGSLEELADLVEVIRAVVQARGYSWQELEAVRQDKRSLRGGFEERILLLEVTKSDS